MAAATSTTEVKSRLSYVWAKENDQKETYEFQFAGDSDWSCTRSNASGARKFRLNYDRASGTLWWGESYFLDPAELLSAAERAQWYRAGDFQAKKRRAAFVWLRREPRLSEVRPSPTAAAAAAMQRRAPGQSTSTKVVVKAAAHPSGKRGGGDDPPAAPQATAPQRRRLGPGVASAGSGSTVDPGRKVAQQSPTQPEVILDLEQLLVIYKPPYWRCELPAKGDWAAPGAAAGESGVSASATASRGPQILLRWIRDKIRDIDPKLFEEEFNPALSGTGFGPLSHRIDQETSGPLLVAKTVGAQRFLKAQFHKTAVSKRYICLVRGKMEKNSGSITAKIRTLRTDQVTRSEISSSGDWAQTDYQVVARYSALRGKDGRVDAGASAGSGYTLVACDIKTGRTHQIRVHMLSLGHALVADYKYLSPEEVSEDRSWCPRLFLHAYRLGFQSLGSEQQLVVCPLPLDLKTALVRLGAAEIDAQASDLLFGETSWQRELFRPTASQWRPGTRLQRRLAVLLAEAAAPMSLSRLNADPELRRILTDEGPGLVGRQWLAKHYDLFEVLEDGFDPELRVRLRGERGEESFPELELERQVEAVRTELEHLDRLKQRAIAEEDYAHAAEVKRRAEAARAELRTLQELLGEAQDAAADGGDIMATYAEERAREQARLETERRAKASFSEDVQDEQLFPSLAPRKKEPGLARSASATAAVRSSALASASAAAVEDPGGVPGAGGATGGVGGEEGGVLPLKDALLEFLSKREGCVAHINEINNDRFIREVMAAQRPKLVSAVNKAWVKQHEDTFVLLRTADNDTYIAICKAVQAKSGKVVKQVKPSEPQQQQQQRAPAYDRVVQKTGQGDPKPLVYHYSAKARSEESSSAAAGAPGAGGGAGGGGAAAASAEASAQQPEAANVGDGAGSSGGSGGGGSGGGTAWQDRLAAALRQIPKRSCSAQELLTAVPQFADATGARRSREQQELLVLFLEGFPKSFGIEKRGSGAEREYIVWAR